MKIEKISSGGVDIALIECDEAVVTDVQSALDLMATIRYELNCERIILPKHALTEEFFDLRTRLIGEVLQKFVQYRFALAIVGDFSAYDSESFRALIRESNRGKSMFFVPTADEAAERLSAV